MRTILFTIIKPPVPFSFIRNSFVGGTLKGNTIDFHALRFFIHGYFEWRNVILARKIQNLKNGDIIEVGANVGTETVSFAKLVKGNRVHAFEPMEENFVYLRVIKEINNFENLHLYKSLVSDKYGSAFFQLPGSFDSGSGFITDQPDKNAIKFPVITLDKQLSGIKSCSLIVIDVEGYELNVLRGGKKIITSYKPYLIIEVNPKFIEERANINVELLYKEIRAMGYECFHIEKFGLEQVDTSAFAKKSNKNWICIPEEALKYKNSLSQSIFFNALNPVINFKIF